MKKYEWKPIVTLIAVIFFGVVAYNNSSKDEAPAPVAAPADQPVVSPDATQPTQVAQASAQPPSQSLSPQSQLIQKMGKDDIKSFSGTEDGNIDNKQIASITVPVSPEEDAVGESDRYGDYFDKFIFKKYPDISKIKFHPDKTMRDDPEVMGIYKRSFYRGLYFAKQIKLANGKTLFDLVTKCSKHTVSSDGADYDRNADFKFYIQFNPTFVQTATGEDFDENILFNRVNDKIIAKSQMFSSAILTDPNFMNDYGLECAKK